MLRYRSQWLRAHPFLKLGVASPSHSFSLGSSPPTYYWLVQAGIQSPTPFPLFITGLFLPFLSQSASGIAWVICISCSSSSISLSAQFCFFSPLQVVVFFVFFCFCFCFCFFNLFGCSGFCLWDYGSSLQRVGSSSLTRDPTQAALLWESRVLTGLLGKSQQVVFLRAHFPRIPAFRSPSYQGLF